MSVDLRDLDPHRERSYVDVLRSRRAEEAQGAKGSLSAGEVSSALVVEPDGIGIYTLQDPRTGIQFSAPTSGGDMYFSPGQVVTLANQRNGSVIVSGPVGGERGRSDALVTSQVGTRDAYGISSASPAIVNPGATEVVTFEGYGFKSGDVLTAVLADGTADSDVTVGTPTLVSETVITASVSVAAGAAPGRFIGFDLSRG